ncbi:C40 family peptidase [Gordonia tangerina]|uniref:NlpC/P60 family protein n=1 Tax=Gordonia tangerina TaxID=2911060 RepID=A0ABS9DNG5_9ACTN|nr:C40 family peptidase [Gordonia tangerina]MCF3940648.1 NlpC/P60 family protein [Gordonia tangerina]
MNEASGAAGKAIATALAAVILATITLVAVLSGSGVTDCAPTTTNQYGMGVTDAGGATLAGLNEKQLTLAANGVAIGKQRGETESVILSQSMAMATESTYRNLSNTNVPASASYPNDGAGSDHDSVGPHQIRVSMHAGGDLTKLMDPVWQINWFYDTADSIGGHDTMDPAALAQAVERSGVPDAYATKRTLAENVIAAVTPRLGDLAIGASSAAGEGGTESCETPGGDTGPLDGSFGQRVIAAAMRWIGTPYAWGGGNKDGPTKGIHDGGVADSFGDYNKVGFDCSGLTLYAVYQASGGTIELGHYTGNQASDPRGQVIALDQKQPGDLIYFGASAEGSHHVGIYYGKRNGRDMLLNAPQSGQTVAVQPLSGWSGEGMYVRRFGVGIDTTRPAPTNQ